MAIAFIPFSKEHRLGVRTLILPIQRDEFGIDITYEQQPDLQDVDASTERVAATSGSPWAEAR